MRLSIAILTLNEEKRIANCIRSASWADEIIVADSGSRDNTVAIARELGAQVHIYDNWQGFAEQRNRLLKHCSGDYVFFLDADEELTPELSQEIREVMQSNSHDVWEVTWEQVAFGKRLTHMNSRGGVVRLFWRTALLRFEGVVHERGIMSDPQPKLRRLRNRLPHHSRETVHGSLLKLAQYAQLGAAKRAAQGKRGGVLRGFGSALANFIRLYFFQRGFLCGAEGFLHCLFVSLECFFRYVALKYDKEHLNTNVKRS